MNLQEMFALTLSPWELLIRGSVIYWFIFGIFRFVIRRDVGSVTIADVLVLVLIADAAQNGMAGQYETITEGLILISTIVGWNFLLDWASFRFEAVRRFTLPPPLPLILHGRILHDNLRKELLSVDELEIKLRREGVADVRNVRRAYMEADGNISILRYEKKNNA